MNTRSFKTIVYCFITVALFAVGSYAVVSAYSGRGNFHGYFTNVLDYYGDNVLPGAPAIPDSVNTVSGFVTFLKTANSSGDQRRVTGSAFIVDTMLGISGDSNHGRNVSSADWNELTKRLTDRQNNGAIDWTSNVSSCVNSIYQGTGSGSNPNDDTFYDNSSTTRTSCKNGPGITIRDNSGTVIYMILRSCANPMGDLPGTGPVVIVPPVVTPNECRPIIKEVVPVTYPAVAASAHSPSKYPAIPATTIPVRVSINGTRVGNSSYSTKSTIDLTNPYTTGDSYPVIYTETRNHITSYTDIYVDDHSKPIYTDIPYYGYIPKTDAYGNVTYTWGITGYNHTFTGYQQKYSYTRTNYGGPDTWSSTIGPCYDYILTAGVSDLALVSNAVEAGSPIGVRPTVISDWWTRLNDKVFYNKYNKNGKSTHTKSKDTQWQIARLVIKPNVVVSDRPNTNSDKDPCAYYKSVGFANCTVAKKGNSVFNASGSIYSGDDALSTYSTTVDDYAAGTKICFAFSVQPHSGYDKTSGDNKWNHSALDHIKNCVILSKKPKVQVWGGDLLAGKSVITGSSIKTMNGIQRTFGSWSEYGIFAAGSITGMASGSAFAGSGLAASTSACSYSTLSFSFIKASDSACKSSTTFGGYVTTRTIPDVAASFASAGVPISDASVAPDGLITSKGVYIGTRGDLTLTKSEIKPGKSIILKISGTVTIAGNLTYSPKNDKVNYTSASQLPQLVIIADKIIINGDVTNVDAWLIANGANGIIETCNTGSTTYELTKSAIDDKRLTVNKCTNPLVVNGPVMAKQLWLRRTAGSGTGANSGDPAEVFNLRSDAYLWAAARAANGDHIQTVYTNELPPRF